MSKFYRYQSLAKLGNIETDGILEGSVYIFPKLDGANASIWLQDGELKCGSRNRTVAIGSDNAGFAAYVKENEAIFRPFFDKNPNMRLYGEWLVPHIFRGYLDTAWRNFYVFDIVEGSDDNTARNLTYHEAMALLQETRILLVPVLAAFENPPVSIIESVLMSNNYLCKSPELTGEGIVIKNYGYRNRYGRQTWAKMISDEYKQAKSDLKGAKEIKLNADVEEKIVLEGVTDSLIAKEKAKIENYDKKKTGELVGRVFHCLLTEELPSLLAKNKYPVVDFKKLKKISGEKVISFLGL